VHCRLLLKQRLLAALLASSALWAQASDDALAATPPSALTAPADPSGNEHRAAIRANRANRANRMQHLSDRINGDPQLTRERCCYESEISTPPPLQRVALTFDDGPEPGQTEHILEVLERHQVPATFFMIGEKARRHPDLVAAVQRSGHHLIGNHSWIHPNFHTIAVDAQARKVRDTEAALGAALNPKLFRYPYGNSSRETNALLKTEGFEALVAAGYTFGSLKDEGFAGSLR
jgi:peptidoglycan-N-acetylglucosamine deacetylase